MWHISMPAEEAVYRMVPHGEARDQQPQDYLKITTRSQQESGSSRRCTARPRYEEINLAFLPEEKRAFVELLGRIQEAKEQARWIVAHYDDFARLFDTIIAVKSKLDIHNGAVALRVMADLAMERLVEMERSDRVPSLS